MRPSFKIRAYAGPRRGRTSGLAAITPRNGSAAKTTKTVETKQEKFKE